MIARGLARAAVAKPGTARAVAAVAVAALLVAACGGSSGVSPAAYVKSVCQALDNWRNTIQSAGVALQSSGAAGAAPSVAKEDYERFVGSLAAATRRVTSDLKAAGTPNVPHGEQISQRLTGAFDQATHGLARANEQAKSIQADSASHFQLGVSAVSAQIRSALGQIERASPGQSHELRTAAAKEPSCQTLAG
jgi:hypothetical protein